MAIDQALQKAKRHAKNGEIELAEQLYRDILQKFPSNKRAIAGLKALKAPLANQHPANTASFQTQFNTLVTLFNQGRLQQVIAEGEIIAKRFPMQENIHNILAAANARLGNLDKSAESFAKVLQITPKNPDAHNNLGIALNDLGRHDEAIECYNDALQLRPDFADAYANLGNTFDDCGKHAEAIESYKKALQLRPGFVGVHNNLGIALQHLGRSGEAAENYLKAIEIKPDHVDAHANLGSVKTYKAGDAQLAQMLQLVMNTNQSTQDLSRLNFTIGKAYGDIGELEKAFKHISEGNRLRKTELKYDIVPDRLMFANLKAYFSSGFPQLEAPSKATGKNNNQPIFIVGMLRSGTTLVEQILDSHSLVHGGGELDTLTSIASKVDWRSPPPPENLPLQIREAYLAELQKISAIEPYVTDKMPLNFQWLGLAMMAFPEAKIVHVQRDSRATCWSIFKHYFSAQGNGYAYDLQDVAEYYNMYLDLMAFWHENFAGRIYDLNYEALTENQKDETAKLLNYVGLEWEDNCLEFHNSGKSVRTTSSIQVREKMYQGSSNEWQKYEEFLAPMIEILVAR